MSMKVSGPLFGAVLGLSIVASPAWAQRDVAIDGDPSPTFSACQIGSNCAGTTLPFSIITPAVTSNQIFIYNSGIVSIGSQLALNANPADVSTLGHAFLAPGFANFGADTPTVYTTDVRQNFGGVSGEFRVTWVYPGDDGGHLFQLQLTDLSLVGPIPDGTPQGFHFDSDPALIGDVQADFFYGSPDLPWNGIQDTAGLPTGALVGWGVGALNDTGTFANNFSSLPDSVNLTNAAAFAATAVVPKSTTWILMLVGFAGVGASLRKARFRGVVQPS